MLSLAQFPGSGSVIIALTVISTFVTSMRYSLSRLFVTSTMNQMVFMGSNKITSTLKLKWLHKQCSAPLHGVSILMYLYLEV